MKANRDVLVAGLQHRMNRCTIGAVLIENFNVYVTWEGHRMN
jgi:hypothetical protein